MPSLTKLCVRSVIEQTQLQSNSLRQLDMRVITDIEVGMLQISSLTCVHLIAESWQSEFFTQLSKDSPLLETLDLVSMNSIVSWPSQGTLQLQSRYITMGPEMFPRLRDLHLYDNHIVVSLSLLSLQWCDITCNALLRVECPNIRTVKCSSYGTYSVGLHKLESLVEANFTFYHSNECSLSITDCSQLRKVTALHGHLTISNCLSVTHLQLNIGSNYFEKHQQVIASLPQLQRLCVSRGEHVLLEVPHTVTFLTVDYVCKLEIKEPLNHLRKLVVRGCLHDACNANRRSLRGILGECGSNSLVTLRLRNFEVDKDEVRRDFPNLEIFTTDRIELPSAGKCP